MNKLKVVIVLVTAVMTVGASGRVRVNASQSECNVVYTEDKTTNGTTVEDTTIKVVYPTIGANEKYMWSIEDWVLTNDEVNRCSIPDDAKVLKKSEMTAEGYKLDSEEVFTYAVEIGSTPDFDTGEVVVYAQPVIRVKEKTKSGDWQVVKTNIRSLEEWKASADWKGSSSFKNFYNKKVKVRLETGVELDSAKVYVNSGSVKSLRELGLKKFSDEEERFYLTGINIDGSLSNDGKSKNEKGSLALSSEVTEGSYKLTDDSSLVDVDGRQVLFSKEGYVLEKSQNVFYDVVAGDKIRIGLVTKITPTYTEFGRKVTIVTRDRVLGEDAQFFTTCTKKKTVIAYGNQYTLKESGSNTISYGGSNKWELDSIVVAVEGETASSPVGNEIQKVTTGTEITTTLDLTKSTNWVVQFDYTIQAPQISLCYFKDSEGNLSLVSEESDSTNQYGTGVSNTSFSRYKSDFSVNGKERDLVLTEAYAYEAPKIDGKSGYLSDAKDCWSNDSEPTGGRVVEYTVDGESRQSVWILNDRDNAFKNSTDSTGKSKALSLAVKNTPMSPLIYVAIYEELPTVYTVSFITSDDRISNDTVLQRLGYSYGTFDYDDVIYNRGTKVTLGLGTTSVDAYSAYAQDGIDDGIREGASTVATDDVRGTLTVGEQTLYCTRYVWVTGSSCDALKNGGDTTYGALGTNGYAGLSSSSLGGRLVLEDGTGMLVKIFTKEIKDTGDSRWAATYQSLEDGQATGGFDSFEKTYQRMQRAQLVGDFRNVIENSTSDVAIQRKIERSFGQPELVLTSVSSQVRNETIGRQNSAADGGGHTFEYHNTLADAIAKEELTRIEGDTKYGTWLERSGNQFNWLNQMYRGQSEKTWNWYIYRYAKSINYASVLKTIDSTGKISYSSEDGYREKELDPYTNEYEFSFVPFREDKNSGKIYVLTELVYGYSDNKENTFDEAVLEGLENSTSSLRGWKGGRITLYNGNFDAAKVASGTDTITKAEDSSRIYNVDKKELKVVGIYSEYTASGAKQGSPTVTEKTISFRDSGNINGSGETEVTISAASVNAAKDAKGDARFTGEIINDVDNSSDSYRASSAVPTSEFLRTSASMPKYLVDLDFNQNTVKVDYTLDYCKAFYSQSITTDKYGNEVVKYSGEVREARPTVERTATNYSLRGSTIWYPEDATIWNYALSESNDQHVTMVRTGAEWVNGLKITTNGSAEFSFPNYVDKNGEAALIFWCGVEKGVTGVSYDADSIKDVAESVVGEITATNQGVTFHDGSGNSYDLLKHVSYSAIVDEPVDAPAAGKVPMDIVNKKGDTVNKVFSSKNDNTKLAWGSQINTSSLKIDDVKDNGIYESDGLVRYVTDHEKIEQHGIDYVRKGDKNYTAVDNGICYRLSINDVVILTPAVVTVAISDGSNDDQSITTSVGYPLVLDKRFTIATSALGSFNGLPGYGAKNYARYINTMKQSREKAVRVRFPFVVIRIRLNASGKEVYDAIPANTWLTIGIGNTSFMLPSFVDEGDFQEIEVRAYTINVTKQNSLTMLEYGANTNSDVLNGTVKNTDAGWNYVAYRILETSVVGRVYGLKITDIGDYPLWKGVFRDSTGELGNYSFFSGLADQNGQLRGNLSNKCFPIVDGDNPKYSNEGFSKLGFVTRFELETVGSMYSSTDLISITPEFYWVDENWENRTKVDLYYDAEVNGVKKLAIKVGSAEDRRNTHEYNFANDDFGISADRLELTANLLGFKDIQAFTNRKTPVFSFGEIQLNQYTRIFRGDLHETFSGLQSVLLNKMVMESGKGLNIPDSVIERSTQRWYGQYYLPTKLHVTDKSEAELAVDNDWRLYKNKENWKTDGYLIVNFTIRTVNDSKYSLIYNADVLNENNSTEWHYDAGHCNMWKTELAPAVKKASNGTVIEVESGDFLIYDVKDFGTDDADNYSGGGTH